MSFVWKAAQRLRTPEQVMFELIRLADVLGMPDKRGAAICAGMCVAQESDFWCPWNAADPESKNYPYDSESNDGRSVGYFQQQKGPNGELWWGSTASEMGLTSSATQFLTRLKKNGYNAAHAQSANDSVQAVQQSGAPQAYKQHWDRINDLYNRVSGAPSMPDPQAGRPPYNAIENWTENQSGRGGVAIDCVFIHTQEPAPTPSMNYVNDGALNLSNFLKSTEGGANPVSYHTVASQNLNDKGVTVVYCADTDNASWSVGNSNARSLNYCFGGSFSAWTTAQWMMQAGAIDAIAWEIVSDCIKYGLTTKTKRPPVDWSTNYAHNPPVISDHRYCTIKLRDGNTHTDVDKGRGTFPWKYFEDRLNAYADIQLGVVAPPAAPPPAAAIPADFDQQTFLQTNGRWEMLGWRTMVEQLALIGDKVLGTSHAGKPGFRLGPPPEGVDVSKP